MQEQQQQQSATLEQWVRDLLSPDARELALLELSKQREKFPELAPYLWNSFGTMAVLLQARPTAPARARGVAADDFDCGAFSWPCRGLCRQAERGAGAHVPASSSGRRSMRARPRAAACR